MTMHNGTISEAAAAAWGVASGAPETQDIHVWIMLKDGSMDLDSRILTNQWRQTGHKRSVFPRYSCRVKRRRDFIVFIPFLSNSLKMKKPGHLRSLENKLPGKSYFSTVKRIVDARIRSLHVGQIRQVFPSFVRNGLPKLLMRFPLVSQIHQHHTTIKCIKLYQSVVIILYWLPQLMILLEPQQLSESWNPAACRSQVLP
jgi:hypothetical protein